MPNAVTLGRINRVEFGRVMDDMQDIQLMKKNSSPEYTAAPVPVLLFVCINTQGNLFEWHFTIRGPTETPYENGIYHGKIVLPNNWPMSPPDIYFLTVS